MAKEAAPAGLHAPRSSDSFTGEVVAKAHQNLADLKKNL